MIVVDTNVVVYLLLVSPQTAEAEAVWRRDRDWWVPFQLRSEFRNVLASQVRQRLIAEAAAFDLMGQAEELIAGRELRVGSKRILELAFASGCTSYDCEFVALAKDLGIRLVTADRKVVASFPETAVSISGFAAGG